jgi:hypothetical protein
MRWGKISSACLQAPQMSSAGHWRTSVWDIVCTIVRCVKMGVVERSWEINTELSWENSDKCHNKMDCSERERREWRRDWTWRDQKTLWENYSQHLSFIRHLVKLETISTWRKAAFDVQIKEESVWPKRRSAKEKKRNMVLWSLSSLDWRGFCGSGRRSWLLHIWTQVDPGVRHGSPWKRRLLKKAPTAENTEGWWKRHLLPNIWQATSIMLDTKVKN